MADPGIVTQNLARSCNEALILSCLEAGSFRSTYRGRIG